MSGWVIPGQGLVKDMNIVRGGSVRLVVLMEYQKHLGSILST